MSGPVVNFGSPMNVDEQAEAAMDEPSGWDWFKTQFVPAAVATTFKPEDGVLHTLSLFAETAEGAKVMAWLHELTDRAPYPVGGASIEELALAAARHQGRAGVGRVLSVAVAEGKKLRDQKKGPDQ
jgi:hypothetical protein